MDEIRTVRESSDSEVQFFARNGFTSALIEQKVATNAALDWVLKKLEETL